MIQENCKLVNFLSSVRTFTFAFSTPCHLSDHSVEMSFLVLFYPVLRLWRRFYLVNAKGKPLPPVESGLYIKDPASKCIYVVGGCRIRYEQTTEGNSTRLIYVRSFKYRRECWRIDLSNVDERRSNGKSISKAVSRKGKTSTEEVPIIPTLYSSNIVAEELSAFPEDLCLAAGTVLNNFLYVFGGSFNKDNSN